MSINDDKIALRKIVANEYWEGILKSIENTNPIDLAAGDLRLAKLKVEQAILEEKILKEVEAEKAVIGAEQALQLEEFLESGITKPEGGCCGGTGYFNNATNPNSCEFGKPRKSWQHANYSCGTQAGETLIGADYQETSNNTTIIKEQNVR